MSEFNKPIASKTQQILKDLGYEIKISHAYELLARLAGEKNWHVGKARGAEFLSLIAKIKQDFPDTLAVEDESGLKALKEALELNLFRDKFYLGDFVNPAKGQLLKNFQIEPNALFVGESGSGKSASAALSLLFWLLNNSDQSFVFITDRLNGATDHYDAIGDGYPQAFQRLNTKERIIAAIELAYEELIHRRELFNSLQAESLSAYEETTGHKMTRLLIIMEEFDNISSNILNFNKEFKNPGTPAFKFHQIMRSGRSLGVWVIATSQKSGREDIPAKIIPNFTQKQVFRISREESVYVLGNTKASEIPVDKRGHCETDYGMVKFPQITKEQQKELIMRFYKPLTSGFAYLTDEIIQNTIQFATSSVPAGFNLFSMSNFVKNILGQNPSLVVRFLHERLGQEVQKIDPDLNEHEISHILKDTNGVKIAIMIRFGKKHLVTQKHIDRLQSGMAVNGCARGIIYTSSVVPTEIYQAATEAKIEILDQEDLLRLARQVDNKI